MQDKYVSIASNLAVNKRINTVMSLSRTDKKNCLINVFGEIKDGIPPDGSIDLLPKPGSKLCTYRANEPWALFVMLLLRYMSQAPTEPVDMLKYDSGDPY